MSAKGSNVRVPWKFKIVGALCLYSLVLLAYMPSIDRLLCAVAMLMSAVGDLFLGHVFSLRKYGMTDFNMGALAFGAAHILYAIGYFAKMRSSAVSIQYLNVGTVIAILICVVCLLMFIGICRYRKDYRYLWVIIVYVCLISVNCSVVFSYAWACAAFGAAAGALTFLISDVCLGLNRVADMKGAYKFVWIVYPIGQFLLITCG